ncbi:cysteine-rich receptor-like protein kinase 11 isoform X2 [Nymphaea colorata]|uniref:cysteine-rich receptor-like protein kinase 11 isoform X2 n=1 Tax=Nymphaea colorata TaxID=210225 RepID=UPI00129DE220|nr:cysteine-rich receptor-like protein kinase 11 isoform X2 [Nymphaea colorata]
MLLNLADFYQSPCFRFILLCAAVMLWWIVLLICLTGGLLLVAACALSLARRRMQHLEKLKQKEATSIDTESVKENEEANYDLPQISLRTIEDTTDKFSKSNKLGEGGYGPLHKGKLPNGQEVTVKRLSGRSGQGSKEFKNEIELIVKLQHVNLVRLIASCLEKGEKMLIYEYKGRRCSFMNICPIKALISSLRGSI